ncbi:hypothetical protein L596_001329 [Steinernema carpocapsae]|uniref:Uncharacterized protein n=1 Tax=Steinernema carpocapsae TaxID=34508 RepID=A0A4U8UNF8_STECR|nr:hypothetical protein L596_001329 [Steinernema carpocapsae]
MYELMLRPDIAESFTACRASLVCCLMPLFSNPSFEASRSQEADKPLMKSPIAAIPKWFLNCLKSNPV